MRRTQCCASPCSIAFASSSLEDLRTLSTAGGTAAPVGKGEPGELGSDIVSLIFFDEIKSTICRVARLDATLRPFARYTSRWVCHRGTHSPPTGVNTNTHTHTHTQRSRHTWSEYNVRGTHSTRLVPQLIFSPSYTTRTLYT